MVCCNHTKRDGAQVMPYVPGSLNGDPTMQRTYEPFKHGLPLGPLHLKLSAPQR